MNSLKEVQETKERNGGRPVTVNVTGLTLESLLGKVMNLQPATAGDDGRDGTNTSRSSRDRVNGGGGGGGNLIIKMDIEGAEYAVLKQVAASGVLCNYIAAGNTVIMLVEFHHRKAIRNGTQFVEARTGIQRAKNTLESCGVVFEQLLPGWS
jgi:Methyltransferase FkbM domain